MRESCSLSLEARAGCCLAPWQALGSDGPPLLAVTPLPRFDGRSLAFPPAETSRGGLTLHYWRPGALFPQVAVAALALALEKAETATTAFYCRPEGELRRALAQVHPGLPLVCQPELSKLGSGGDAELKTLIQDHDVSVVVIDNLGRLLPRIHWRSPSSRIEEAEREVLRQLRDLVSGLEQPTEVHLFYLQAGSMARQLLEDGLVDEIQEVRL